MDKLDTKERERADRLLSRFEMFGRAPSDRRRTFSVALTGAEMDTIAKALRIAKGE